MEQPDPSIGSEVFIGESNFNGLASQLKILDVLWGRRVDVADSSGEIKLRDFVINDRLKDGDTFAASDGTSVIYGMDRNGILDSTKLSLSEPQGTAAFEEAILHLSQDLKPIRDRGLGANDLGVFSMVPRNGTMVVRFDDLLEGRFDQGEWVDQSGGDAVNAVTGQLNRTILEMRTGYPPEEHYDTRIILDPNHGNLADRDDDGVLEFHSTRVIVCMTVSEIEALISDPPLSLNAIGLPASHVLDSANVVMRIPTALNPSLGQVQLLRNASGHALSFHGNGSTNSDEGTPDVVRALRSGGSLTQDAHNGFLIDEIPPTLLGELAILIDGSHPPVVDDPERPERFRIPVMVFTGSGCNTVPKVGDVIVQQTSRAVVVNAGTWNGYEARDLIVDVMAPQHGTLIAGTAHFLTQFDGAISNPGCFVRFSPAPTDGLLSGVSTLSKVRLRFTEPMDPDTLRAFDTFTVTRTAQNPTPNDYVVGKVISSPDLRSFSFEHDGVPFQHQQGLAEAYYVNIAPGDEGPTDLAGNPLTVSSAQVEFQLLPSDPSSANAGFAMRFDTPDEFADDGFYELRNGQILYDPINERILPRPVSRFSATADRNQPVPSVMAQFPLGVQTPLSNLGSKLQTLWRYVDVGFSLTDETNVNVDVEGISWAPTDPSVVSDVYEEFAVILSHSEYLPDEFLIPPGQAFAGLPMYPASGIKKDFSNNRNDPVGDPGKWVHPKTLGYTVHSGNLYSSSSGTTMLPYPLNQDIPLDEYRYYTWRDTALTALGGPSNGGAILDQEDMVIFGGEGPDKTYETEFIPTVGLPLLMEFRCYPSEDALGLNSLDISLAVNSSARPNFRAFSTGGYDNNNVPQPVDPDDNDIAQGGYNPLSVPVAGDETPPTDPVFYIGELALVTRVSRAHTVWFDTGYSRANFLTPLIEPEDQPLGTSVVLAFRGSSQMFTNGSDNILNNAANLDFYGNSINDDVALPFGLGTWVDDIHELNDARYFQVRISFISNAASGQTAELQSLGFAYFDANASN